MRIVCRILWNQYLQVRISRKTLLVWRYCAPVMYRKFSHHYLYHRVFIDLAISKPEPSFQQYQKAMPSYKLHHNRQVQYVKRWWNLDRTYPMNLHRLRCWYESKWSLYACSIDLLLLYNCRSLCEEWVSRSTIACTQYPSSGGFRGGKWGANAPPFGG